jgi:hypothetical protein
MAEGYKAWTGGQVLNGADLTDYCSSQAVMRFANAAGRDAALTVSIVKEGMLAYLLDTNILTVNTTGLTTGWIQIYPVITSGITDANVTNAKLAANSVTSANIVNATIVGADIASATITGANIAAATITGSNILDGTITPADVAAGTYGISISGNAATASNSTLLDGYAESTAATVNTIALRSSTGGLSADIFSAQTAGINPFVQAGTYTYIGFGTARVVNATNVYDQAVASARPVLINSSYTLGTSTSSARFKEEITPLAYEPADILKLNPISFRYREDHVEPGSERLIEVGLIAEEVAALGFEEIVYRGKDGEPDGVAYDKIAVVLLKLCQDQQTQLDALSARLDKIGA